MSTAVPRAWLECCPHAYGAIIFKIGGERRARMQSRRGAGKKRPSALTLFMTLVLGTDYHNFAVPFDYLALVAHGFY